MVLSAIAKLAGEAIFEEKKKGCIPTYSKTPTNLHLKDWGMRWGGVGLGEGMVRGWGLEVWECPPISVKFNYFLCFSNI